MTETGSIMMIEDDDGHARLIEKNIRRAGLGNPIRRFADGTAALAYLFAPEAVAGDRPALILLDLNLPDVSGIDILNRIKSDCAVRLTPVIVLTTTDDQFEVQRCYELGCNIYVTKPLAHQSFASAIRQIGGLMAIMQLPDRAAAS